MTARPPLTDVLSGAELRRWYWTKAELGELARTLDITRSGSKQELTDRVAAHLDGDPEPPVAARPRGGTQLGAPLELTTVIPAGQRCSQLLRSFFTDHVGPAFRFDAAMREFVADRAGATLGDAVDHWHATRDHAPSEIGAQFELNRFSRAWHAEHPDGTHAEMLRAWEQHRSLPAEERQRPPATRSVAPVA